MARKFWILAACAASLPAQSPANQAVSPEQALERLRAGNDAYAAGKIDTWRLTATRRTEVSMEQHPTATILSCSDSRVPPEVIFNQGLGDLFVVRVSERGTLGSIEYAAGHLGSKLVVVMGHASCGAVKAAMDSKAPTKLEPAQLNLESLLSAIRPALAKAPAGADAWTAGVYASVEQSVQDILKQSPVLEEMARSNKIRILGALYHLDTGHVSFSRLKGWAPRAISYWRVGNVRRFNRGKQNGKRNVGRVQVRPGPDAGAIEDLGWRFDANRGCETTIFDGQPVIEPLARNGIGEL